MSFQNYLERSQNALQGNGQDMPGARDALRPLRAFGRGGQVYYYRGKERRTGEGRTMVEETFLTLIYQLSRLPVRAYDGRGERVFAVGGSERETEYDRRMLEKLRQCLDAQGAAFISYQEHTPVGVFGCRAGGTTYVLGPFCYGMLDGPETKRLFHVNHLGEYPVCRLESARYVVRFLTRGAVQRQDGPPPAEVESPAVEEMGQLEAFQVNHTYREEQRLYACIRLGNVEELERHVQDIVLPHPLVLGEVNRNEEYMAVTGISLAARAAIEGGMSSREAFLYNDLFLKKVAACREAWEMHDVQRECYLFFARLMRARVRQGEALDRHVEECKRAIIAGRFERLSIAALARDVGVSKEYLQKLFKKHEGMPINEYIQAQKLEAACELLIYSDRKIHEIADCLHFGSASHFSIAFKRKMNISPREYRRRHRLTNF